MNYRDTLQWSKTIDTDDTDQLLMLADTMEELEYPNVSTLRNAVERLALAHVQGMDKGGTYDGVFWEIRRRVIRLQTEVEHWLNRKMHGAEWSGPYQT